MIGNSSLLAAVLTVVSVVSLSLLSLLCLRCKKKSTTIHEETQIYNPQTFQREGSMFAVTRSKTVTRTNQISSTTIETREEFHAAAAEEQSDYENITDAQTGSLEHTYVAPLPISLYANEQTEGQITEVDQDQGVYANMTSESRDDEEDYENSEFLDQVVKEQDTGGSNDVPPCFEEEEPDYVNQNRQ
ncbi:uncharacterized protein ABDE67_010326 [Symphorus nematophorus]